LRGIVYGNWTRRIRKFAGVLSLSKWAAQRRNCEQINNRTC